MDRDLFKNRYNVSSNRLKNWDYTNGGYYFVTICTQDKEHYFGEIKDAQMHFSEIGEIAKRNWKKIPAHFPHAELDTFVIMPNHIHGIVFIDEELLFANVEARNGVSKFSKPIKGSLSVIINRYKGSVKRDCNQKGYKLFHWQRLFHDRVIRNEKELYNVRKYIENNPINWINDEYF